MLIWLQFIGLFLSSFWCTTFIFLSPRCIRRAAKKISDFFFYLLYYCFSSSFSGVFLNIIHYGKKKWKFYCVRFRFVLWRQNLTYFCVFNFLTVCHAAYPASSWFLLRRRNQLLAGYKQKFVVFLQVINIKLSVEFFLVDVHSLNFSNKRCLETWPCVCGHCTCGLFLCVRSLRNIRNIKKKTGPGCSKAGYWTLTQG